MSITAQLADQLRERDSARNPRVKLMRAYMADKGALTNIASDNGRNALAVLQASIKNIGSGDKPKRRATCHKILADCHPDSRFSAKLSEAITAVRAFAVNYLDKVENAPARMDSWITELSSISKEAIGSFQPEALAAAWWAKIESLYEPPAFGSDFESELEPLLSEFGRRMGAEGDLPPAGAGYREAKEPGEPLRAVWKGWDPRAPR